VTLERKWCAAEPTCSCPCTVMKQACTWYTRTRGQGSSTLQGPCQGTRAGASRGQWGCAGKVQ